MGRRREDTPKAFLWRVVCALVCFAILAALILSGTLYKASRAGLEHVIPKVDPNKIIVKKQQ